MTGNNSFELLLTQTILTPNAADICFIARVTWLFLFPGRINCWVTKESMIGDKVNQYISVRWVEGKCAFTAASAAVLAATTTSLVLSGRERGTPLSAGTTRV